jgi:S1-C subfamily serine protease
MSQSAVVRVYATSQDPDYDSPWQPEAPCSSTGSGVVVGEGLILTGAHVVVNATFLQVQKVADPNKYVATVHAICHDADLALLRTEDTKFMTGIESAEIGDLPELRDRVTVLGYPIGGDEISITEGVVSRIEVQRYSHSQRELLAVTVDAAINDGNSGGPVLKDGQIVGIAFQALSDAENIGEMVPAPILRRFLSSIDAACPPLVPDLGIETQTLENPALRQAVGLDEARSGVLVQSVNFGSSAWGRLEAGDVLLTIDGHAIANNGTIRYAQQYRTGYEVLLGEHFVGDALPITIVRAGEEHDIALDLKPFCSLVPRSEYDRDPTWFVYAGLVFQVLTRNYLCTWNDWWDKAPAEFLSLYFRGLRTAEREEVVILTHVLADEINVGYEDLDQECVVSVNDHRPTSMRDFVACMDACHDRIMIKMSRGGTIVLDAENAQRVSPRILSRYHISTDRSSDLVP